MNHFNHEANNWDTKEKIALINKLATKTKEQLNLQSKIDILDIGCGTGLFGLEFIEYIDHLIGVDNSVGMLKIFDEKTYQSKNINSLLCNLDVEELSIDKQFDLIISAMAFHHIEKPDLLMNKLKSKLKPNGKIAIVDLEKEDGSFHPDPINMGVKHFGFSNETLETWAKENDLNIKITTINSLNKNDKTYHQFLAIFTATKH